MDVAHGAFLVAFAGVILNLANFLYTKKRASEEAFRQRIFGAVDELIERTRETADETQRHLIWEQGRSAAAQIYRHEKRCRLALQSILPLIGQRGTAIQQAFNVWNNEVFGEGFPVSKKECKFLPGSDRYRAVSTAQETLEKALNQLIADGCKRSVSF